MKDVSVSRECGRRRAVHTSSNVPNPPGRPIKAPERFAISTLRSCMELTTIWWITTEHVSEPRGHRKAWFACAGQARSQIYSQFPPICAVGRTGQHFGGHGTIPRIRTSPLRFSSNRSAIAVVLGLSSPLSLSPPAARIAYGMIPVTLPPSKLATAPDTTPMMPLFPPPYTRGRFVATSACATAMRNTLMSHAREGN